LKLKKSAIIKDVNFRPSNIHILLDDTSDSELSDDAFN